MLSKSAQYAVRSTIFLAIQSNESNRINVSHIAEKLQVPSPFLAKLLQQLSKANLISSTKGIKGGFYLSEENKKNTLWDVISCIDGGQKFNSCFLGKPVCNDKNPCVFHEITAEFMEKLREKLQKKSLKSIAEESDVSLFY